MKKMGLAARTGDVQVTIRLQSGSKSTVDLYLREFDWALTKGLRKGGADPLAGVHAEESMQRREMERMINGGGGGQSAIRKGQRIEIQVQHDHLMNISHRSPSEMSSFPQDRENLRRGSSRLGMK